VSCSMRHACGVASRIQPDAADDAPHHHLATRALDRAGQRARKPLRSAAHVTSAPQKIAPLRDCEVDPPECCGVVMIVGQVRRKRALDGFIVAENAIELLRQRQTPVANRWNQLYQRAKTFARILKCNGPACEGA